MKQRLPVLQDTRDADPSSGSIDLGAHGCDVHGILLFSMSTGCGAGVIDARSEVLNTDFKLAGMDWPLRWDRKLMVCRDGHRGLC